MSRETKAQLAIHRNVYQHNTNTHNRGPMPEIHKATDNKEGYLLLIIDVDAYLKSTPNTKIYLNAIHFRTNIC